MTPSRRTFRPLLGLTLLLIRTVAWTAEPSSTPAGGVRFVRIANSAFDRYTQDPTTAQRQWMQAHYWRMLTYSPYFDSRLSWFSRAWVYKDLYAIYTDSALAREHPEWILRDAAGNALYIPYACAKDACPQYAADVGNAAFRAHWMAGAAATLTNGYLGLFVDDVNMRLVAVGDGAGRAVAPHDRRTGQPMREADWRRYIAEFTEQIRGAFPRAEIVHNALWFLGHEDPFVQRELLSADLINLERGINDDGLRGGAGKYGLDTFFAYVDWLHAHGRRVVFNADATSDAAREYGLAGYFLVSSGSDGVGNGPAGTPDDWWSGYDVFLGEALGPRYSQNGIVRRDFQHGLVLLNEPAASSRTVELGRPYTTIAGRQVNAVTLGPAEGAVLRHAAVDPTTSTTHPRDRRGTE